MKEAQFLIIDSNQLIAKAFKELLSEYSKNVSILPDRENDSKEKIEALLLQKAHKHAVIINANCAFTHTSDRLSCDGILLLQQIYENAIAHEINIRPLIISFSSLKHLKSLHNPICKILLENEQLYYFNQLPFSVQKLKEYFNNWRV